MKPRILMIENDRDDRYLTEEMFAMEGFEAELDFIFSHELLNYTTSHSEIPHLVILDLSSGPYRNYEKIREIRSTAGYESVPVIVLSNTAENEEIDQSYKMGANSFIKKPGDYPDTLFKISNFIKYWFKVVELPQPQRTDVKM